MTKQAFIESQRVAPLGQAGIDAIRRIKQECQAAKVNQVLVDAFSASAILAVYDALNPTNREKLLSFPVGKVADVCFKLINKQDRKAA